MGRVHPKRPFRTFFSWLEDERPGFPERGRYSMWEDWHEPRLRYRNEQVTEDREAPGQRPGEMRSGQTPRDRVRTGTRSRGAETGTSEEGCVDEEQ